MEQDGLTQNLKNQLKRWRRRHNQKSNDTRARYDSSLSPFVRFLAEEFHLQKLSNIEPRHFNAYVAHRIETGIAASTLRTDLSAIRLFIDQFEDLRADPNAFPSNETLKELFESMPERTVGGVVRAWTQSEFQAMVTLAKEMNRPIVAQTIALAYWLGLRLHETIQIDHARITNALRDGYISINGKGGKWRDIPLCDEAATILQEARKRTTRGARAFVEGTRTVKQQMQSVQHFIANHRAKVDSKRPTSHTEAKILDEMSTGPMIGPLTYHGLRHSYAMREYARRRARGMSPLDARLHVSRLLGHERDDVTRIYLSGDPESTIG